MYVDFYRVLIGQSDVDSNSILDNTVTGEDLARTNLLLFASCGTHIVTFSPGAHSIPGMICVLPAGLVSAGDDLDVVATLNTDLQGDIVITYARIHPTQDNLVQIGFKNVGSTTITDTDLKASAIVFDSTFSTAP